MLLITIQYYENLYKKRNMPNSGGSKSFNTSPPDGRVSNNIIHPVSSFDNSSTIGNSVFGTENFKNKNIFNNTENDVVTETFIIKKEKNAV